MLKIKIGKKIYEIYKTDIVHYEEDFCWIQLMGKPDDNEFSNVIFPKQRFKRWKKLGILEHYYENMYRINLGKLLEHKENHIGGD